MTRLSKKVLLPMAALSLAVVTGTMVAGNVSADEVSSEFPPVVQALVEKFNLNPSEVEAVMDEQRMARQSERLREHQARLDAAVAAGQLTEAQRTELEGMMSQHQKERREMRDSSPEERRSEASKHHDEMEAWAETNGVNLEDFMPERGERMHGSAVSMYGGMGKGTGQHAGYGR